MESSTEYSHGSNGVPRDSSYNENQAGSRRSGRLGRPRRPVSWEEGKLGGLGAAKLRRWGLGGQEVQEARGRRKLGCCMANCEAGRVRSWCGCGERGAPKLDPKWAPK